jgi:hypothetical protein
MTFQEPSWAPFFALGAQLPLWSRVGSSIHETFQRSGVNPEMGLSLYRIFQKVGLPAPSMHMEIPLGSDADFTGLICDLLGSLRPLAQQHNVSLEDLGDFETLPNRIQAEIADANTVVTFVAMVGAWSRKPMDKDSVQQSAALQSKG